MPIVSCFAEAMKYNRDGSCNCKDEGIVIKIPFKTPSINHLYWHKGNIKILKTEAKKLREEIKEIIYKLPIVEENLCGKELKVEVEIHENWYTKKGDIKRVDLSNREKFLLDSVFYALGMDDKCIFKHAMIKVQSDKEFAIIKIYEHNK